MKNKIRLIILSLIGLFSLQLASAQNIVEIDLDIPVRLGWDYPLPDSNVQGFRVYRKVQTPGSTTPSYQLVATTSLAAGASVTDLFVDLPSPYIGTYVVRAFNEDYESANSEEITLIEMPQWTVPAPPTNLRVIQITPP